MSITIEKITKFYGEQQALSNISCSLKKGEIVGFLGPNGAGKSTLMRIITCYLQQDSGKVKICDLDTQEKDILVKSKIGYLPEHNPLYTDMYNKGVFVNDLELVTVLPNKSVIFISCFCVVDGASKELETTE